MTDKELLEMAAKAAGLKVKFRKSGMCVISKPYSIGPEWNPLTDDGDALRLAVKLGIQNGPNPASREPQVFAWPRDAGFSAEYVMAGDDIYAATRRAIVRAAAEIGKAMP